MRWHSAGRLRVLSSGAAALALAGAAAATTVQKLDFAGLTRLATHVLVGRVQGADVAWTSDGGAIVTLTTVEVASQWKGSPGAPTITVRTPGGEIGGYRMEIPGSPGFRAGETVLLFLERNADGTYGVVSLAQGSFRVLAEADRHLRVERDPNARHLIAVSGRTIGPVAPVSVPLFAVQADVERAIRATSPAAEADEVVVPLSDVERGGGR